MIHLKRVTIWSLPFTLAAAVAMVDFVPLPWNDFPLQDFSITLNYYVWQTILFAYIKNTVQLNILLLFITVFSFILYFLCIEWYLLDVDVFLVSGIRRCVYAFRGMHGNEGLRIGIYAVVCSKIQMIGVC